MVEGDHRNSAPVDVISFDLDHTLCRYTESPAAVLDGAFAAIDVEPFFDVEAYVATFDAVIGEVDDMAELRRTAFERLAAEAGIDERVGRRLADAYTRRRTPTAVAWREGMDRAFDRLAAGRSVVVVTNGLPDAQRAKLEGLGVADRVDAVICADGADVARKPSPEPFERALEAVDGRPERAVHVGNSIAHDVVGANRAGLRSMWFPDEQWHVDEPTAPEERPTERVMEARELMASTMFDPSPNRD